MSTTSIKIYFDPEAEILRDFVACLRRHIGCISFDILL